MEIIKCYLTLNDCYKINQKIIPKGICVHSTGANNTRISRYVQPAQGDPNYQELINIIGENKNKNSWQKSGVSKCVHAFVGKLADGTIGVVQTLPLTTRGWHSGSGKNGSLNNDYLSFEICEDDLKDENYFNEVYKTAVNLCVMWCKEFNLDPLGKNVILCHKEGARLGKASDHYDVEHWFPKFGKTMEDFRNDVKKGLEEEEMTGEQIYKALMEYLTSLPESNWSVKEGAWREATDKKVVNGLNPRAFITREEVIAVLSRLENKK